MILNMEAMRKSPSSIVSEVPQTLRMTMCSISSNFWKHCQTLKGNALLPYEFSHRDQINRFPSVSELKAKQDFHAGNELYAPKNQTGDVTCDRAYFRMVSPHTHTQDSVCRPIQWAASRQARMNLCGLGGTKTWKPT